jgi:hypothetical protein
MLISKEVAFATTAGATQVLTTSLVASPAGAFKARAANALRLGCVTSGTAATSVDVALEWSSDGTTWYRLMAVNSVSGGSVDADDALWVLPGANGNHELMASVPPNVQLRVSAKRNGGDATSALLARAILTRE